MSSVECKHILFTGKNSDRICLLHYLLCLLFLRINIFPFSILYINFAHHSLLKFNLSQNLAPSMLLLYVSQSSSYNLHWGLQVYFLTVAKLYDIMEGIIHRILELARDVLVVFARYCQQTLMTQQILREVLNNMA